MTDQATSVRHNEQVVDSTHHAHHIVAPRVYIVVFILLLLLTYLTVHVAFFNIHFPFFNMGGLWNLVVALLLATIKATLVALWFMHVRFSGRLIQLTIVTAIMFLMLMLFGTLMDVWTRHNIELAPYAPQAEYYKTEDVVLPHGTDGNHM